MDDLHTSLVGKLARLYNEGTEEIRRIAAALSLEVEKIKTHATPVIAWGHFVSFAESCGVLERLVKFVIVELGPDSEHVQELKGLAAALVVIGEEQAAFAFKPERLPVPDWSTFSPPEFERMLDPTIPEGRVRVVRTRDASGAPNGPRNWMERIKSRLSLLLLQGPQLCGKTWHAREVIVELAAAVRHASQVIYVQLPGELHRLALEPALMIGSGEVDAGIASRSHGRGESHLFEPDLRIFALWAHRAIQEVFRCPELVTVQERLALERNPAATNLIDAAEQFGFVLSQLRRRAREAPRRRRIDLAGDIIIEALRFVPALSGRHETLLIMEVDNAHLIASRALGVPDNAGTDLLRSLLSEVEEEAKDPLGLRGPVGNQRLKVIVTTQYPDERAARRDSGHIDNPIVTVGFLDQRDIADFLADSRVRELVGEEVAQPWLATAIWELTSGYPWFLARLIQGLAFLRSNIEGWEQFGGAERAVNALARGRGLWLFKNPFESPECLMSPTAFPEMPTQESPFLAAVAECLEENRAMLDWLRGVELDVGLPSDGQGTREERERFALPLLRLGVLRIDPATGRYQLANKLIRLHFSATKLEEYCSRRPLFETQADLVPAPGRDLS